MTQTTTAAQLQPRFRFRVFSKLTPGAGLVALCVLAFILLMSYLLPVLTGYAPDQFVGSAYLAPSLAHPFGTDAYGRDVMVRTFVSARVDYLVPLLVVAVSVVVGNIIGTAAALIGGFFEWLVLRVTDVIIAFPFIILILALVVAFGNGGNVPFLPKGTLPIVAAVLLTAWAYYARLARSQALSLSKMDYVTAGVLMGYSTWRILIKHISPKVLGMSVTYAIGDVVVVMGLIASLSLFGAGIAPPTPEWGQMMFEGRAVMDLYWWVTVFPLLFMVISAVSLAAIAERLVVRLEGGAR